MVILSIYGIDTIRLKLLCVSDKIDKRLQPARYPGGSKWFANIFILLCVLYTLSSTILYLHKQFQEVRPLDYITGKLSRDEYISLYRYEYPAFKFINEHTLENSKVLFFYLGGRGYYCDREYIPDNGNSFPMLHHFIEIDPSGTQLMSFLKENGITHFLIFNHYFMQHMGQNQNRENSYQLQKFMLNYTKKVFDQNGFAVFKIALS
ncbi:hypothetical protein [Desulfamplus magnetovallimortis]|uniref:hypothetical protein n=1 Tax=Desulfamplus magnetovallimortis TaxID=1246637 RepID=UPI0009BAB9B8|nr:hypothetical protein [Desulfamplus magnetovallimortis]